MLATMLLWLFSVEQAAHLLALLVEAKCFRGTVICVREVLCRLDVSVLFDVLFYVNRLLPKSDVFVCLENDSF